MHSLAFPPSIRVRKREDYLRLKSHAKRTAAASIVMLTMPNNSPTARLGLIVSRRYGDAVRRNRFKRIAREVFRLNRESFPAGTDFVFQPRGKASEIDFDVMKAEMLSLVMRSGANG